MPLHLAELKRHTEQNDEIIENQRKIIDLLTNMQPKGREESAGNETKTDTIHRKPRGKRSVSE